VAVVYLVQHAEKRAGPGDPGLTERGRRQAARTGQWLRHTGLIALYSSPLRRAWQTAQCVAAATGLRVQEDGRLRERMNWDGSQPIEEFLADWVRSTNDRDFVPATGESSRQAGQRLHAFLADREHERAPVAAVTHGGVTVDLLRTVLGDQTLPSYLIDNGVPACAATRFDGLTVIEIASTAHLS
jgi:broad specificity phosphatase PhoE